MTTLRERIARLKQRLGFRRTRYKDSAYGRRPSGAGPVESLSVTLKPVDPEQDGLEVVMNSDAPTTTQRIKR